MCGIYGMISQTERPLKHLDLLPHMGASLRHRGPDASGTFHSAHAAIGAERLSIVDPRPQARQPYVNPTLGTWLVCNGEVYNAPALRSRFASYSFRSRCDVETLMPLLHAEGVGGLERVEGMFAVAWWRDDTRSLTLARDRAGEKPLFYAAVDGELWFASEIQALLLHPRLSRELNRASIAEYLALGYVREPRTPFQHISKVPAGATLTFHADGPPSVRTILDPPVPTPRSLPGAARRLRQVVEDAVAKQLTADVPVGVFTSGGIDSALIATAALRAGHREIQTFTASFTNRSYDESGYARRLSRHLGIRHVEASIGEDELAEAFHAVVPRMAEPLADPALLPTYLLARTAARDVGVVLTGEGADELFGGYPTYLGHLAAGPFAALPSAARRALQAMATRLPAAAGPVPLSFLARRFTAHAAEPPLHRHVGWIGTGLMEHLPEPGRNTVLASLPPMAPHDPVRAAMDFDFRTYLRDGLLVKLDRACMLASLEARAPYLDPAVIGLARGVPTDYLIRGWRTKRLLVEAAAPLLPGWILRRRKRGLSVPIAPWINGALRQEVDRLLGADRVRDEGVLPPLPIGQLLSEHRAAAADHARALWPLVMLQSWLENWGPGGAPR